MKLEGCSFSHLIEPSPGGSPLSTVWNQGSLRFSMVVYSTMAHHEPQVN
ncbi:MAG: hypothetical protein HXS52_00655 [Theionarchaea archaeon]|nr:hypothetical protein [Theionarchaea archaeon]